MEFVNNMGQFIKITPPEEYDSSISAIYQEYWLRLYNLACNYSIMDEKNNPTCRQRARRSVD